MSGSFALGFSSAFCDIAQKNVRYHGAGESKRLGQLRQVVCNHISAEHCGKMQNLAESLRHLFVVHRGVAGAASSFTVSGIARARGSLNDKSAAASTKILDASRQALNP